MNGCVRLAADPISLARQTRTRLRGQNHALLPPAHINTLYRVSPSLPHRAYFSPPLTKPSLATQTPPSLHTHPARPCTVAPASSSDEPQLLASRHALQNKAQNINCGDALPYSSPPRPSPQPIWTPPRPRFCPSSRYPRCSRRATRCTARCPHRTPHPRQKRASTTAPCSSARSAMSRSAARFVARLASSPFPSRFHAGFPPRPSLLFSSRVPRARLRGAEPHARALANFVCGVRGMCHSRSLTRPFP